MSASRHQAGWQPGATLRRLLLVAAFGAALFGPTIAPAAAANATGSDYSAGGPAADADRDIGKAAVRPQTQDLEALPKRRIGGQSTPPAAPVSIVAHAAVPMPGARPCPDALAAGQRTARRNGAAQPRAPPASRS